MDTAASVWLALSRYRPLHCKSEGQFSTLCAIALLPKSYHTGPPGTHLAGRYTYT